MRFAYYNENDPYAAQWLRNLIAAGEIPAGDVDDRDIQEVTPDDLKKYTQCHFFAGIGGWPYALNLAGWPEERPVWTGSCPCQPLSGAGQRKGHADQRHLWPAFYRLIAECRPTTVFGEQVASKDGREWFSAVRADLEATGYACGCANLAAASVGAPHIRQRLFWVADAESNEQRESSKPGTKTEYRDAGRHGRVADAEHDGSPAFAEPRSEEAEGRMLEPKRRGAADRLADAESGEAHSTAAGGLHAEPGDGSGMGDANSAGHEIRTRVRSDDGAKVDSNRKASR